MDGGAWWAAVHGIAKSRGRLSNFTVTFHFHFSLSCIEESNGNPLQYSCLENPRDRRAWWAAVYGVAQSQTRLKRLSSSSSSSRSSLRADHSLVAVRRLLMAGFPCCRVQALGHTGFSSSGLWAPERRLSSRGAWA